MRRVRLKGRRGEEGQLLQHVSDHETLPGVSAVVSSDLVRFR